MDARNKAYRGARAAFDVPHKADYPTDRSIEVGKQVLGILDGCTDDEFATVLMACMMILGERLAEKKENKSES